MGNFCEQYGLPPIAHSRQKGKKHDKIHKDYNHKNIKDTKPTLLNQIIFMLKRNIFLIILKNMINRSQEKANSLIVVNLDTIVKTASKNLVS